MRNRVVRWTGWNQTGLDHCEIRDRVDTIEIEGMVVSDRGSLFAAHYLVHCDPDWQTRFVRIAYADGLEMSVATNGNGSWHDLKSDRSLPLLDGCFDVDIGATAATNTLAIKRLKLAQGKSSTIKAAYVPLPSEVGSDFVPIPVEQRYTCLALDRLYRYAGLATGFAADLELDDFGFVLDYPETFRRMSA